MKIQDLIEGCKHGEYYCSTDKKWKCRTGPKQTRKVSEGNLNEFAPGGDGDGDEDPYKYPKPKSYRRSIDFFGQFEADHFDREDMNDATGEFKGYWGKTQIAYFKFDNPAKTGSDDPGMGWYYEPNNISDDDSDTGATPAVDNSAQRKQQELSMINAFLKSGQTPKPGSQIYSLMKRHGVAESGGEPDIQTIIQSFVNSPSGQKYKQYDCKTVTRAFVQWAEQNKIPTQVVSLAPPSADFIAKNPQFKGKSGEGDGHIMPIVNGNAIDFTVRQFGVNRPFENPLVTPAGSLPAVYGKFGYFTDKPEWFLGGKSHWIGALNAIPPAIFNQNFGDEMLEHTMAEAHPNSKIYDKCWDGYKKVPGKKRGEPGSCIEETYDGDEFYEAYGELWYNEDEQLDEAEYQGRSVPLGKPMQGDVKKFKVYVKDPSTGNVKKVNFGDPDMRIKKSNPARRKSFRARHNCDNPGPRTKARYWSCRKW
jgi:hypothetical protein